MHKKQSAANLELPPNTVLANSKIFQSNISQSNTSTVSPSKKDSDTGLKTMPEAMKKSRMSPSQTREHQSGKSVTQFVDKENIAAAGVHPFNHMKKYFVDHQKNKIGSIESIPPEDTPQISYTAQGISPSMAGRAQAKLEDSINVSSVSGYTNSNVLGLS